MPPEISECKRETKMTNRRGETGESCGVPTETGAKIFGDP